MDLLSVCLSVYLSIYLSIYLSVCLSVCPSVRPPARQSVRPSVHPCMHASIHPSIHPSTHIVKKCDKNSDFLYREHKYASKVCQQYIHRNFSLTKALLLHSISVSFLPNRNIVTVEEFCIYKITIKGNQFNDHHTVSHNHFLMCTKKSGYLTKISRPSVPFSTPLPLSVV